jgi:N utilization substance protein B
MRRRIIRERALQALYAHEISRDPVEYVLANTMKDLEKNARALAFATQLVAQTVGHVTELDEIISAHLTKWNLQRISLIDRLTLRMAVCELLFFSDIPPKTSINEAIELAKLFGTEDSATFVNGILDAVYGELLTSGRLNKSGRGLMGHETRRVGADKPAGTAE